MHVPHELGHRHSSAALTQKQAQKQTQEKTQTQDATQDARCKTQDAGRRFLLEQDKYLDLSSH